MGRLRIIIWYAVSWSYLVLTYPMILFSAYMHNRGKLYQKNHLANIILLGFAKITFYLSGSTLKIIGKENIPKDKTVVFASNHQGHMDSMIIHGFIKKPKGFVSIKQFQRIPILRTWMRYMGCVFIDRKDIRQTLFCINQAVDNLKHGHSMVVFPEGKLNDGKKTLEFEKGWLRLVKKSGVCIVPITIKNSYNALSYNVKEMHPTKVECIISEPIETYNLNKENEQEFIQNLKDTIIAKL